MQVRNFLLFLACSGLFCGMGLICFLAGYMMASKELADFYMAEALADRVSASIYSTYGDDSEGEEETSPLLEAEDEGLSDEVTETEAAENAHNTNVSIENASIEAEASGKPASREKLEFSELYEAQLIGFGARKNAESYVEKLRTFKIKARVVERESISSRGRKVFWYQVVTDQLPYHELLSLVSELKKRDNLDGVVLVKAKQKRLI